MVVVGWHHEPSSTRECVSEPGISSSLSLRENSNAQSASLEATVFPSVTASRSRSDPVKA